MVLHKLLPLSTLGVAHLLSRFQTIILGYSLAEASPPLGSRLRPTNYSAAVLHLPICFERSPLPVRHFVIQVYDEDVRFHRPVVAVHIGSIHVDNLLV